MDSHQSYQETEYVRAWQIHVQLLNNFSLQWCFTETCFTKWLWFETFFTDMHVEADSEFRLGRDYRAV